MPRPIRATALVVALLVASAVTVQAAAAPSFTTPLRMGVAAGDDWEPALAADRSGRVFVEWKHYDVAGAPLTGCGDPVGCDRRILVAVSTDGGKTFGPARAIDPGHIDYDSQIAVDPVDGRTVYASFLQDTKSSIGFTRSADGGVTWSPVVVTDRLQKGTDKDILAVRGQDVYIAYNAIQKMYVSASHDGGRTWSNALASTTAQGVLGWALGGGGTVTPNGDVYFAWAGYEQNGGAKGPVNLFVTYSRDRGATWTTVLVDRSQQGMDCGCAGFAFFSSFMALAGDEGGRVHVLYSFNATPKGPARMLHRSSVDRGVRWSAAADVSLAPTGADNLFPAIVTAGSGGVRVAWMDDRTGRFKVYERESTTGGASFGPEAILSANLGYPYQTSAGFGIPYGDYFELEVDAAGKTLATWGEAPSYDGPGNVFFARQR
jgi:hypothetical protein